MQTRIILVPVPSRFRDQNYFSPGPVPLSGPKLFQSQSRPAFGTKISIVPIPSRLRDQVFLSPGPIPLTRPEMAESQSRSQTTKAELCHTQTTWTKTGQISVYILTGSETCHIFIYIKLKTEVQGRTLLSCRIYAAILDILDKLIISSI